MILRNWRKRQRLLMAAQIVLTAGLVVAIGYPYMNGDRNGPEITFSDNERILSGNMTEEELVRGVIATDAVDGDVSATLRVESATQVAGDRVLLVYAARDKSNNISSMTRTFVTDDTFNYKGMIVIGSDESGIDTDASQGADEPADLSTIPAKSESVPLDESLQTDEESVNTGVESTVSDSESKDAESETDSSVAESANEESAAESSLPAENVDSSSESAPAEYEYDSEMSTEDVYRQDQYIDAGKKPSSYTDGQIADLNESLRNANNISISRLPDGYPVIRLNTYAVRKSASESFTALRYISDIRDDADPAADIFGRISVTGNGELNAPGVHTVNYYVTDADGNRSNVAHLVVIVTE